MTWLNAAAPYNSILRHIKNKGIKVIHREFGGGAAGLYDCKKTIITIHKKYRETWDGCFFLCHEFIHHEQCRYNEFPEFFNITGPLNEEALKLVIEAELDADKRACKMLKMWGVKYEPASLTEAGLEQNIKFWKKYYGYEN